MDTDGIRKHGGVMYTIVCKVTGERFSSDNDLRRTMSLCRYKKCKNKALQAAYTRHGRRAFKTGTYQMIKMLEQSDKDGARVALFGDSTEAAEALGKKSGKSIDKAVASGKTLYGSSWKMGDVQG